MPKNQNKLTIIMYHYVRELVHTQYPGINALLKSQFIRQLDYLKKHYTFISVSDCISALKFQDNIPNNSCLLTFDDGYIDHYLNVFPILDKYKIQGCFFPPAKAILNNEVLDVNKIHFILSISKKNIDKLVNDIYSLLDVFRSEYNLKSNDYYFSKLAVKDRFDSEKIIFVKRLLQVELEEELRGIIISKLFNKYVTEDEVSFSKNLYMDLDQIKCMIQNGMYFGSHGFNHYWLNSVSEETQIKEIDKSISFLKTIGAPTNNWIMCYPYGAYNNSLIKIIKKRGCAMAFTSLEGIANISNNNAYTLNRYDTNDFPK